MGSLWRRYGILDTGCWVLGSGCCPDTSGSALRSEMGGRGDHLGSGLGFLLGLVFVARGLFCVSCFLFCARTLAVGLIPLRLRSPLVLFGRGLGRVGGRRFGGLGGSGLFGRGLWLDWGMGWIYSLRPLRRMFGFGLGRLVLVAMIGLLCGLLTLTPLGLGGRVLRGGNLGGGRNRPGFLLLLRRGGRTGRALRRFGRPRPCL